MRASCTILVVLLLASAAAAEQPPPPDAPKPSPEAVAAAASAAPAAAEWIRTEDIAERADWLERRIEASRPAHSDQAQIQRIDAELKSLAPFLDEKLAEADELIAQGTSLIEIDDARRERESVAAPLVHWRDSLALQARAESALLDEIEHARTVWQTTRARSESAGAGKAISDRIDDVLALMARTAEERREWRASVLAVHDRIVDRRSSVDFAIEKLAAASAIVGRSVFLPTRPPIWRTSWSELESELGRAGPVVRAFAGETSRYLAYDERPFVVHLLLVLGLTLGLARISGRAKSRLAGIPDAARAIRVLERPYAAGLMIAVLATPLLHPVAPRRFVSFVAILAVVAAARVLLHAGVPATAGMFATLFGVLLLDRLSLIFRFLPALGRLSFVLAIVIALGLSVHVARHLRRSDSTTPWLAPLAGVASWSLAFAFVAEIAGWSVLAMLLVRTIVAASTVALYMYAAILAVDAIVSYVLVLPPFDRSLLLVENPQTVRRIVSRALTLFGIVVWVRVVLVGVGVWSVVSAWLQSILYASVSIGDATISIGGVAAAIVTLVMVPLVARAVDATLQGEVFPRTALPRGIPLVLSTLIRYGLYTFGFLTALAMAGLHLTEVSILVGGLGIGVGMGLQDVVKHFAAGVSLLIERRIHVGDALQIPDRAIFGRVLSIGIRATVVRNWDGAEVVVPNSDLISNPVTNWTLTDRTLRIEIPVGVAYGADPRNVIERMLEVARADENLLESPAPSAILKEFSDSSILFSLQGWIDTEFERADEIRSDLAVRIHDKLKSHGFTLTTPDSE